MPVIVTDSGFSAEPDTVEFVPADTLRDKDDLLDSVAVDLPNDADVEDVASHFGIITAIRIPFPSFSDGRGFSLARNLRLAGYEGRLRASGHVLCDQYAMARRSGFDEVEIDDSLAARQPESEWLANSDWESRDYRKRIARP